MGSIERRIRSLEDAAGGACQTCAENPITVVWVVSGDDDSGPTICPECGREAEEIEWTT